MGKNNTMKISKEREKLIISFFINDNWERLSTKEMDKNYSIMLNEKNPSYLEGDVFLDLIDKTFIQYLKENPNTPIKTDILEYLFESGYIK